VTGIGGIFVRARNPEALARWYAEHLGVRLEDYGGANFVAEAGDVTVWSLFTADSDYFPREQAAMVNFRVGDLDAMLAHLRAGGADVDDRVEEYEYGRFGWFTDPEGNRVELWEPATSGREDDLRA
jgi:predicted enzyme related to lactoylglutathione lyase